MTELHVKANNSKSYDFTTAAPEKNAMMTVTTPCFAFFQLLLQSMTSLSVGG